jgi:hypothetical protein
LNNFHYDLFIDVPYYFQGVLRGYVHDREYIASVSVPDQQPTVGSTKDLSVAIDFLPGEDDIKLREGKIYRYFNRKYISYSIRHRLSW